MERSSTKTDIQTSTKIIPFSHHLWPYRSVYAVCNNLVNKLPSPELNEFCVYKQQPKGPAPNAFE